MDDPIPPPPPPPPSMEDMERLKDHHKKQHHLESKDEDRKPGNDAKKKKKKKKLTLKNRGDLMKKFQSLKGTMLGDPPGPPPPLPAADGQGGPEGPSVKKKSAKTKKLASKGFSDLLKKNRSPLPPPPPPPDFIQSQLEESKMEPPPPPPPFEDEEEQEATPPPPPFEEKSHTPPPPPFEEESHTPPPPPFEEESHTPPPPPFEEESHTPPPPPFEEESHSPPPPPYEEETYTPPPPPFEEEMHTPPPPSFDGFDDNHHDIEVEEHEAPPPPPYEDETEETDAPTSPPPELLHEEANIPPPPPPPFEEDDDQSPESFHEEIVPREPEEQVEEEARSLQVEEELPSLPEIDDEPPTPPTLPPPQPPPDEDFEETTASGGGMDAVFAAIRARKAALTSPEPKPVINKPKMEASNKPASPMADLFAAIKKRRGSSVVEEPKSTAVKQEAPVPLSDFSEELDVQQIHLDTKFAKYGKMLKAGLPPGAIIHKMKQDGIEPPILDGSQPAQSVGQPPKPVVQEQKKQENSQSDMAKYRKMLKAGLPEGAVRHKMAQDGVSVPDRFFENKTESTHTIISTPVISSNDDLAKYQKMLKAGLPEGAVRHKMAQDGFSVPDNFFQTVEEHIDSKPKQTSSPSDGDSMAKYRNMIKAGLPRGAVEHKMKHDGVEPPSDFFESDEPSPFEQMLPLTTGQQTKPERRLSRLRRLSNSKRALLQETENSGGSSRRLSFSSTTSFSESNSPVEVESPIEVQSPPVEVNSNHDQAETPVEVKSPIEVESSVEVHSDHDLAETPGKVESAVIDSKKSEQVEVPSSPPPPPRQIELEDKNDAFIEEHVVSEEELRIHDDQNEEDQMKESQEREDMQRHREEEQQQKRHEQELHEQKRRLELAKLEEERIHMERKQREEEEAYRKEQEERKRMIREVETALNARVKSETGQMKDEITRRNNALKRLLDEINDESISDQEKETKLKSFTDFARRRYKMAQGRSKTLSKTLESFKNDESSEAYRRTSFARKSSLGARNVGAFALEEELVRLSLECENLAKEGQEAEEEAFDLSAQLSDAHSDKECITAQLEAIKLPEEEIRKNLKQLHYSTMVDTTVYKQQVISLQQRRDELKRNIDRLRKQAEDEYEKEFLAKSRTAIHKLENTWKQKFKEESEKHEQALKEIEVNCSRAEQEFAKNTERKFRKAFAPLYRDIDARKEKVLQEKSRCTEELGVLQKDIAKITYQQADFQDICFVKRETDEIVNECVAKAQQKLISQQREEIERCKEILQNGWDKLIALGLTEQQAKHELTFLYRLEQAVQYSKPVLQAYQTKIAELEDAIPVFQTLKERDGLQRSVELCRSYIQDQDLTRGEGTQSGELREMMKMLQKETNALRRVTITAAKLVQSWEKKHGYKFTF